ncbi:hypothetical protein AVEN_111266-1 [Araneus ventricosus]|uniref:Uncharacterized protein n=1 Tax=Araneus ventricosus TaxID=182803 RepID=A0A4Y2DHE8_ARAVE|nr:hypothetical protein AVEN_5232-1 [Araneus ventricosus]GBM16226.1 hypothetical protein AVEN_231687-1 [Araneus ventricosus]GBM16233.1 hypothetical protein AVEN_237712-1 [Araneus ventricosus]GBM16329.1 hypothetical protein AVEN_111266-1 [Araneus ventricosus]
MRDFEDHDYKELFMEFWYQNPEVYKAYVNTEAILGFKIFMKFVKKHFGFVFDEKSFALKTKFRAIVFQREILENESEKENVEFFKFLVRESVTTKASIDRFSHHHFMGDEDKDPRLFEGEDLKLQEFFNIPLGELMYLIDEILENV